MKKLATNFNQCNFVFRNGYNSFQCLEKCEFGLCDSCSIRGDIMLIHNRILRENIQINNKIMVEKCFNTMHYEKEDIISLFNNYFYSTVLIIFDMWMKSPNQQHIIKKHLILKELIISDIYNEIIKIHYNQEYFHFIYELNLNFL
jgi:hypothetical protein